MLQRTLGGLDDRLVMAFQTSFRQFGSQTDTFITQMGNRLNAFSNTFGIQVSALQGAVAEVISTNALLHVIILMLNFKQIKHLCRLRLYHLQ